MTNTIHQTPFTKHNSYSPTTYYLLLTTLFLLAFLERTVFDLGPNIELITTAMILSAFYLGARYSLWLVLAIMVTTDLVIGNTNIFLFTWSGFLISVLLASVIFKKLTTKNLQPITKKIFTGASLLSTGFIANIFFFFWTNFGVWLLGTMYAKNLTGLMMSYVNAIPFFKAQLTSTLIFIPLLYITIEAAKFFSKKYLPTSALLALVKKPASR
jgi:hypothetical protein